MGISEPILVALLVGFVLVVLWRRRLDARPVHRAVLPLLLLGMVIVGATTYSIFMWKEELAKPERTASYEARSAHATEDLQGKATATPSTQPSAADRAIDFEFHAPDDFGEWTKGSELVPPATSAPPRWALTAADSERWVGEDDRVRIGGRRPSPAGYLVGYSPFEADQQSAKTTALRSAAAQLKALVLWNIKDDIHTRPGLSLADSTGWCDSHIREHLAQKEPVAWFVQHVTRPYGDLHRAAVQVDASPQTIDQLAAGLRVDIQVGAVEKFNQRRELFTLVVACLGLALVVFFLYLFLNAGTKGFFAWPLRVLSLGALGLLYLGLFFLKGWVPQ